MIRLTHKNYFSLLLNLFQLPSKPRPILIVSSLLLLGSTAKTFGSLIPPIPIATFSDFTTSIEKAPTAITCFSSSYSFTSQGLSLQFAPQPAGKDGLCVLNNVNKVDFNKCGAVELSLTNPNNFALNLFVMNMDPLHHEFGDAIYLPANTTQTFALDRNIPYAAYIIGMHDFPLPYAGDTNLILGGSSPPSWSNITSVQIYVKGPFSTTAGLIVHSVKLLQGYSYGELMALTQDQYGQSTINPVENLVTSDQDLQNRLSTEQQQLKTLGPLLTNVDAYQGCNALPQQTATGRFYLQQVSGKWWFVDPNGYLYWLSGVDTVDPTLEGTPIMSLPLVTCQDRTPFFNFLPLLSDPLANNYGKYSLNGNSIDTYNFYTSNLQRKFQTTNWQVGWKSMAVNRLLGWGFTGFGSYSEYSSLSQSTLPYISYLSITGNYDRINTGFATFGPTPDPFDPQFKAVLTQNMTTFQQLVKSDPHCIGLSSGIELAWTGPQGPMWNYGLAVGSLSAPFTSPAHQAFIQSLTTEYGTIASLNAAWNTTYASFQSVSLPTGFAGAMTTAMQVDFYHWGVAYCHQYFTICRNVIKSVDPKYLYLGTEIGHYTSEVMQGAKGVVDAMCVNRYAANLDPTLLSDATAANIPLIVSEFSVGSPESGMFLPGGIYSAPTEAQRDAQAMAFYNNAIVNPMVVGVDWYQYIDQPLFGSAMNFPYTSNYNAGLVDITDTPYAPLISAFEQFHKTMYQTRY